MNVLNNARKLMQGLSTSMTPLAEQRLEICRRCPHRVPSPVERCGLCGCVLRAKTALVQERCADEPRRW